MVSLARVTPHGQLDPRFRTNDFLGMAATALAGEGSRFYAALVSTNDSGEAQHTLGRYHSDGTLDSDYPLLPVGGEISELLPTPEGKLFAAGKFESLAEADHKFVALLNPDGSLDSSFSAQLDGPVLAIAFQTDGKILLGGDFSTIEGLPRNHLARLLPSGALDTAFNHGRGPNGTVHTIAVQPDGAILAGGDFSEFSGHQCQHAVRLKGDSVEDGKFVYFTRGLYPAHESTGTGALEIRRAGGLTESLPVSFELLPGTAEEGIDFTFPTLQTTFEPGESRKLLPITIVRDTLQEGREQFQVLLKTSDPDVQVSQPSTVVRIQDRQTPGTYDASTQFPVTGGGPVAVQEDGMILTGQHYLVRLHPNGEIDPTFTTNEFVLPLGPGKIQGIIPLPDGKIYVLGDFWHTNQNTRLNLYARLNPDGTIDRDFVSPVGDGSFYFDLYASHANPDGVWALDERGLTHFEHTGRPVYIQSGRGWDFSIADNEILYLAQNGGISARGAADDFAPWLTGTVLSISSHNGQLWAGGSMWNDSLDERLYLARINFDGSLDQNFQANLNGPVQRIVPLANNRICIAGGFTEVNGVARRYIAVLHTNGALDQDFDPGFGPSGLPTSVVELSDGSLLLSGSEFNRYDGEPVPGLIRIFRNTQNSKPPTLALTQAADEWQITAAATPGTTYALESSTDLITWSPVAEQTATTETVQFTLEPPNEPRLFYRLRLQP